MAWLTYLQNFLLQYRWNKIGQVLTIFEYDIIEKNEYENNPCIALFFEI